jgi:hypothetical protein
MFLVDRHPCERHHLLLEGSARIDDARRSDWRFGGRRLAASARRREKLPVPAPAADMIPIVSINWLLVLMNGVSTVPARQRVRLHRVSH